MVASTAREYLQSLAGDARGNSALIRELAEAHYKLSRVEVGAGQSAAALVDGEKALAMLREVKADRSVQPHDRAVFVRALTDLARFRMSVRDVLGARPLSAEALNNARDWAQRSPGSIEAERALTDALTTEAGVAEMAGELAAARQAAAQAVALNRDAARRHPDDDAFAYGHGRALSILARICVTLQDGPCAIESGAGAAAVLGRLVERQPGNVLWRDVLAMSVGDQASGLAFLAEKDPVYRQPAVDVARRAYTLSRENARRNPDSIEEADTANLQAMRLAIALNRVGRNSESERFAHEADATAGELVARDPKNRRFHRTQINTRALLGEMLMEHAQWNAAAKTLASAESLADDYLRDDPQNRIALDLKVSALTDQAIVSRHFGRLDAAREHCRKALDIAAALISRDPSIARAMGDLEKARRLARELGLPDPSMAVGAKR
jgi:tetratricopeptide (TPR) repeat protein